MFPYEDVTKEEEEKIIQEVAEKIHKYKMEAPAIMFLETSEPIAFIGGELGRYYLMPILPALQESLGLTADRILQVFEKRENVEKLVKLLEKSEKEP